MLAPKTDGRRVPRMDLDWETRKVLPEQTLIIGGIAGWHCSDRSDLMSLTRWASLLSPSSSSLRNSRSISAWASGGDRVLSSVRCNYRVPRGSVLGPLLFIVYTSPIANVIVPFRNVHHAQYSDATRLYIALSIDSTLSVINDRFQSMHRCLDGIGFLFWFLNRDKSEAIVTDTSAKQGSETQLDDVTVAGVAVTLTVIRTARNLDVTTDNMLSADDHINNVCKAAHFRIRTVRHIRRCVSVNDAKTMATAMLSSRVDYWNSIR